MIVASSKEIEVDAAIGFYEPKDSRNVGSILRSAQVLGIGAVFTVGSRFTYRRQPTDTMNSREHLEFAELQDFEELETWAWPLPLVGIEMGGDIDLAGFAHPERAVYILGNESRGLPSEVLERCAFTVQIPTEYSLNVAVAGSFVIYDRVTKLAKEARRRGLQMSDIRGHAHRIIQFDPDRRAQFNRSAAGCKQSCRSCGERPEFAVKIDGRWKASCQGHAAEMLIHCDDC